MKTYKTHVLQVKEDILALSDFKTQASKILHGIQKNGRPVVITQNGKPAGVLITPEEFDHYREREAFVQAVAEGKRDASEGRVHTVKSVESFLDKSLGKLK